MPYQNSEAVHMLVDALGIGQVLEHDLAHLETAFAEALLENFHVSYLDGSRRKLLFKLQSQSDDRSPVCQHCSLSRQAVIVPAALETP